VGKNFRRKDWNVVTGVGFTGDVERLLGVLGELLEEQCQKSIDILACSDSVADSASTVGVSDVDWLVKEDDRSVGVPRHRVVNELALLVDRGRTKLHEKTGQRRASRSAVEPEDDWIILGVVTRLEEPYAVLATLPTINPAGAVHTIEEMLVCLIVVEVSTVLLDLVNIERCRVNLLCTETVVLELAINLTLFLSLSVGGPDTLNVGTLHDVVPFTVMLADVGLWKGEQVCVIHSFGEHECDLIPDLASLSGERLESVLEVLDGVAPCLRNLLRGLQDLLRKNRGRSCSEEQR